MRKIDLEEMPLSHTFYRIPIKDLNLKRIKAVRAKLNTSERNASYDDALSHLFKVLDNSMQFGEIPSVVKSKNMRL